VISPAATLLVVTALIFLALALTPGDPVAQILGSRATDDQRELLRERLGLDLPVPLQFFHWLGNAAQGDFGISFTFRQDVSAIILPRLEVTLTLVLMSAALILIVGIGLGIAGGVVRRARSSVSVVVALLISIPSYVAASFLISVLAIQLELFPTFGAGEPGLDRIWHLTLPAVALSAAWVAYIAQLSMASIAEERGRDHVTAALGRGLSFGIVLRRHILRNAALPVVTASGLMIASLVAGAIVVETAFAVDGIGSLLVKSVLSKDQPVVLAISVIVVVVFVIVTTVVDILHLILDPRLREERKTA
jgi:peptide/nickel transport system permease protein